MSPKWQKILISRATEYLIPSAEPLAWGSGIRQKTITNKRQSFLKEKMGDSGFLPKEGWRENKGAKHRMGKLGNGLGSARKRTEALPDSLPDTGLKQSHLHKAELAISKLSWKTICLLQIKQALHGLYEGL